MSPLAKGVVRDQADLDLVGGQRRRHRRLQQRPVPCGGSSTRRPRAPCPTRPARPARRRSRRGPSAGRGGGSAAGRSGRCPSARKDASTEASIWARRGVVMLDPRAGMPAGRRDDVAFGDDLDPVAQAGAACSAPPSTVLGHVAAIDVGLVHRGDALREAGLDLGLHMGGAWCRCRRRAATCRRRCATASARRRSRTRSISGAPRRPAASAGVAAGTRP